jgi:hypothetical protein
MVGKYAPNVRRAFVAILVLALFSIDPRAAVACSCAQQSKPQLVDNAALIFTGTVTAASQPFSLTRGCYQSSADPTNVAFDVETVYKGDVARRTTVETAVSSASCGAEFTVGRRYTVFARVTSGRVETNLCGGNAEGTIVAADYGLGEGRPPK